MAELYAASFGCCDVNENIVAAVVRFDKSEAFVLIIHLQYARGHFPSLTTNIGNRKPAAVGGDGLAAGTSAAAVLSARIGILRQRGADFNTASGLAPPVPNREPESISFHADGRFCTLKDLRKRRNGGLCARVLTQRLQLVGSPNLVAALFAFLCHNEPSVYELGPRSIARGRLDSKHIQTL